MTRKRLKEDKEIYKSITFIKTANKLKKKTSGGHEKGGKKRKGEKWELGR